MKSAVIQLNAGNDKNKNIAKALWLVQRAIEKKAEFILLPEAFHYRGKANPKNGFQNIAEGLPGPSTAPLMAMAKKHKIFILAGSICERIPGRTKTFNTSALIDRKGQITARYRKMHLFEALIGKTKIREAQYFSPGRKKVTAKIGPWKAGLSICYDLRFPDLYRDYAREGADLLCVPSAFTKMTGQAHWETLLRARAIENLCYVLAPNQIGRDSRGIANYGNSMIIDPWGKILARASGDKEEVIFARLDVKEVRKRRKALKLHP